jgi:Fic family protein
LKWDTRLEEINKDWSKLWNAEEYNAFADAVAFFKSSKATAKKVLTGYLVRQPGTDSDQ